MTSSYYDQNGKTFFQDTVNADVSDLHARFLCHLRPGASILDAGCGSGRDALAFAKAGFEVTAFDASSEMVKLASQYTGLPVLRLAFDEVVWDAMFDGVWASASLLHVQRSAVPTMLAKLVRALRPSGVLFMSFKYGAGERIVGGRLFTDMTDASMEELMATVGLARLALWRSDDVRPGRSHECWVNAIGRRAIGESV